MGGSYGVRTRTNTRKQIDEQLQRRPSRGKVSKDFECCALNAHAVPAANQLQIESEQSERNYVQLVVTVKVLLVKFVSTSRRGEILQSLALQFIAEMRENVFDELKNATMHLQYWLNSSKK